jgi:hypothetical protein
VILYVAGNLQLEMLEKIAGRAKANHFLCSFADPSARKSAKHFCTQHHRRIFVDSGAFTAWAKGKKVDLGQYMAFCKQIIDKAKCPVVFAALDVIPGKKQDGRKPTQLEIQKACDEGWENYQAMKQKGIEPCLMTFHQFEHQRQLKRIADESDYFAVSPRKSDVSREEKLKWLAQVFNYIQGKNRRSINKKIHGLGVSSVDWMEQFPFYSVDNTGWIIAGRANLHRHFVGHRPVYWSLEDWKRLAEADRVPTWPLRKMLGFGKPGARPDPQANSGGYWLQTLAMRCEVETESYVTELWRSKGVDWDDQTYIKPAFTPKPWWDFSQYPGLKS